MPKVRGNYYINLKAFWVKIRDEKLVNKAVKISGYMLIIGGILCLISIAFKPVISIIVIGAIVLFSLLIYIYVFLKE